MSLTFLDKTMNSRLSPVFLLLYVQGSLTLYSFPITCSNQNICAVTGAEVTLSCSYSTIDLFNHRTGFWFSEKQSETWRRKDEPEDLILDSDYSGRVNQRITDSVSELTIRDLRETDSGEYQIIFFMKDGAKHLGSVAVNLTVTVLQVKIHSLKNQPVQLTCDTSCSFNMGNQYNWYKNGQFFKYAKYIDVSLSENTDRYYCSNDQYINNPSIVCAPDSSCWNVIYTTRSICVLVGSTVDVHSTYSHPTGHTVGKTFWHHAGSEGFMDLREEPQLAGRVNYVGNTLRIKDVKLSDSGKYAFRIISNASNAKYSSLPGVDLTVTDVKVTRSPDSVSEGEKVILSCLTECTLDKKYAYIWYKNKQQVTDGFTLLNKLYLDSVNSAEIKQYSCKITDVVPETSTWLWNTVVILSLVLTLPLIGVLWYRIKTKASLGRNIVRTLSINGRDSKEETQYKAVHKNAEPSEKDFNNQDIHYSSINFAKLKNKHMSTVATTVCPTDTMKKEEVHYATVMFS